MALTPLHDRVLVRRVEGEEKTAGGLIIPDSAKEKPAEGEIVAVGAGLRDDDGDRIALDVKRATAFCLAMVGHRSFRRRRRAADDERS